jgi:MFS transporter, BCD family, chlorophyll transporter
MENVYNLRIKLIKIYKKLEKMENNKGGLSTARNIKIAFFHLGSGMADVLMTGVWNRIMISDLGISATPVSLLTGLRYFLAPLGIWAGRISDKRSFLGFRRLFWIWLGRLMMLISTFGLGLGTVQLMQNLGSAGAFTWGIIVVSMILFSFGSAISGSTFLALIYDRSKPEQRGRAVGIVWTFLLLGFTVGGILFSILLPRDELATGLSFTAEDLMRLFVIAGVVFIVLWFFSLLGEEQRGAAIVSDDAEDETRSWKEDLRLVWENPMMRFFLFYLTLSMFFAFSQDPILEPFAGDVFDMDASLTNRFAAYWGSMAIIGSVFSLWLLRKRESWTHTRLSQVGVAILIVTFALFTISAFMKIDAIITPSLLLLGLGLGFWNIGTLGLMMDLSPLGRAGTFLGFWSMIVTLARGGGISTGGIVRDLGLMASNQLSIAYGSVFAGAFVGLSVALWCLNNIHVEKFKTDAFSQSEQTAVILSTSLD